MSTSRRLLRNSLMFLTLATAVPLAWAADAPAPAAATAVKLNVPMQSSTTPPTPRVLDLKAPDIHDVMTPGEITAAIPNPEEMEVVEPDTVQVHGAVPAPYVPMGIGALYWAFLHPMDSWRILAPVQ